MARRRKNKRVHPTVGRDIIKNPLSLTKLPRRISVRSAHQLLLDAARLSGQDYRAYNPTPKRLRPARTVSGRIAFTNIQKTKPLRKARFFFENPKRVTICVRRSQRKEVLHALKKTGRGRGRHRSYRRNLNSLVRC